MPKRRPSVSAPLVLIVLPVYSATSSRTVLAVVDDDSPLSFTMRIFLSYRGVLVRGRCRVPAAVAPRVEGFDGHRWWLPLYELAHRLSDCRCEEHTVSIGALCHDETGTESSQEGQMIKGCRPGTCHNLSDPHFQDVGHHLVCIPE